MCNPPSCQKESIHVAKNKCELVEIIRRRNIVVSGNINSGPAPDGHMTCYLEDGICSKVQKEEKNSEDFL